MEVVADARRFTRQLVASSVALEARARLVSIQFARRVRRSIAGATPFDTGRAAASWNASVGGPNTRVQPPEFQVNSKAEAIEAGEENLLDFTLGDDIHISNSAPYIRRLNAGHSKQAPSGFVETTVQKVSTRALREG